MTIELRKDELKLIQLIRRSPRYSSFKVEKRPTKEFPNGELQRVVVETSELFADIVITAEI